MHYSAGQMPADVFMKATQTNVEDSDHDPEVCNLKPDEDFDQRRQNKRSYICCMIIVWV